MSGFRHNPRVRFTPALWEKWRKRQELDADVLRRREGIQVMRSLLAARDILVEWHKR